MNTRTASFSVLNNTIIHSKLKPNIEINIEDIKENFKVALQLLEGKKMAFLLEVEQYSVITKEAREFILATEIHKTFVAYAVVASNLSDRIVWNFVAKKYGTILPSKSFFDTESALNWLNSFFSCEEIIDTINMGQKVQGVFNKSGMSVTDFAYKIHTTRENVYNIFDRKSMSSELLQKISQVLNHDFFMYYNKNITVVIAEEELELLKSNNELLENLIERFKKISNYFQN